MIRVVSLIIVAGVVGCSSIEKSAARSTATLCEIHKVTMRVQEVQLVSGSSAYLGAFRAAMSRSFPNHGRVHFAEDHAMLFSRRVNLLVCPRCTEAYDDWQAANQQRPNQAPEPTRMLVTCRADARPAPSIRVAHL